MAAFEMISEEGFAALSMRKLAERVEYSAASIYLYFENRDRLAQELREFGFQQLLGSMEAATAGLDGRKALHAMGAAYLSFGSEQAELYRLIFMGDSGYMRAAYSEGASDDAADRAYALLFRVTKNLKGVPDQRGAAAEVADVIWSCLHGIVSLQVALSGLQDTPPEEQVKRSLDLLADGLERALTG